MKLVNDNEVGILERYETIAVDGLDYTLIKYNDNGILKLCLLSDQKENSIINIIYSEQFEFNYEDGKHIKESDYEKYSWNILKQLY